MGSGRFLKSINVIQCKFHSYKVSSSTLLWIQVLASYSPPNMPGNASFTPREDSTVDATTRHILFTAKTETISITLDFFKFVSTVLFQKPRSQIPTPITFS